MRRGRLAVGQFQHQPAHIESQGKGVVQCVQNFLGAGTGADHHGGNLPEVQTRHQYARALAHQRDQEDQKQPASHNARSGIEPAAQRQHGQIRQTGDHKGDGGDLGAIPEQLAAAIIAGQVAHHDEDDRQNLKNIDGGAPRGAAGHHQDAGHHLACPQKEMDDGETDGVRDGQAEHRQPETEMPGAAVRLGQTQGCADAGYRHKAVLTPQLCLYAAQPRGQYNSLLLLTEMALKPFPSADLCIRPWEGEPAGAELFHGRMAMITVGGKTRQTKALGALSDGDSTPDFPT